MGKIKFLFVMLFIGWIIYQPLGSLWKKFSSDDKDEPSTEQTSGGKRAGTDGGFLVPSRSIYTDNQPTETIIKKRPVVTRAYKFKYRAIPNNETLSAILGGTATTQQSQQEQRRKGDKLIVDSPLRTLSYVRDAETNSVFVIGELDDVTHAVVFMEAIDVVVNTCHLKTWVVFVRGDKTKSFDLIASIVSGRNGIPATASLNGGVFTTALSVSSLQASFRLEASKGNLEVVQQPYMQLRHSVPSEITTVERIAIPSTTVNQGVSETSIAFENVGLKVNVVPWFMDKDRVRLDVEQSNGVVGQIRSISGIEVPEISSQTLKTSSVLRMGQVLVLGGVQSVERQKVRGFLQSKDVRKTGHLYVVAAIYSTIPKAKPVIDLGPDVPLNPFRPASKVPFLDRDGLLPSRREKLVR